MSTLTQVFLKTTLFWCVLAFRTCVNAISGHWKLRFDKLLPGWRYSETSFCIYRQEKLLFLACLLSDIRAVFIGSGVPRPTLGRLAERLGELYGCVEALIIFIPYIHRRILSSLACSICCMYNSANSASSCMCIDLRPEFNVQTEVCWSELLYKRTDFSFH